MSDGAKYSVRLGASYSVAAIFTFVTHGDLFSFAMGVIAYLMFWNGLRSRLLDVGTLTQASGVNET